MKNIRIFILKFSFFFVRKILSIFEKACNVMKYVRNGQIQVMRLRK